jgi:hypothetical protein
MSVLSERIAIAGRQRCPRRDEGLGYAEKSPDVDTWQLGRWAATQAEADAEVAEFIARYPTGSHHGKYWHWAYMQPRTCSFCGGIHPDDAITLVVNGWRTDMTDKGYKRYMEPPGDESISPPVKLYAQHFTDSQREAFNAALREIPLW